LSAKCEEAGGIDLIVIYNSGRYRMAGRLAGLLAYGNANEIVMDMAKEVLPVTKKRQFSRALTETTPSASLISFWMILKRLALQAFRTSQPWG
jgi:predicted TIM-barrel enzyme